MEGEYLSLKPSLGGAVAFAAAYFIVGFPLKLIGGALFRQPWSQKLLFYTVVPFYSPRSWDRSPARAAGDLSFAGRTALQWLLASAFMPSIDASGSLHPSAFIPAYGIPAFTSSPKRWAQYFACCFWRRSPDWPRA